MCWRWGRTLQILPCLFLAGGASSAPTSVRYGADSSVGACPDPMDLAYLDVQDEGEDNPALQFLQRAARSKVLRRLDTTHHSKTWATRLLAPHTRFELEACAWLDLLPPGVALGRPYENHREVGVPLVSLLTARMRSTEATRTRGAASLGPAGWASMLWAAGVVYLVTSSAAGAARAAPALPRDDGDSRLQGPQDEKVLHADEQGAWRNSFCRWLSMSWMDSLMGRYGKSGAGTPVELHELGWHGWDTAAEPQALLREAWAAELSSRGAVEAKLLRALRRVVGLRPCCVILLAAWATAFLELVGMVMALDVLLAYAEEAAAASAVGPGAGPLPLEPTLMAVGLLFTAPLLHRCCSVVLNMVDGYYTSLISSSLGCLVFEKAMRLPVGSGYRIQDSHMDAAKVGLNKPDIVQLLSVDTIQEWTFALKTLALLSAAPFALAALACLLAARLRLAGVLGALYLFPGLIASWLIVRWSTHFRRQYQGYQDVRLQRLAELVTNARAVKALMWEKLCCQKIHEAREGELNSNQAYTLCVGLLVGNIHLTTWVMALSSLFICAVLQGAVAARDVWVIFQIMASMQACLHLITGGLRKAVNLPSSVSRLECFLKQPERPHDVRSPTQRPGAPVVQVTGSFTFEEGIPPVLHNLDLVFARGELIAIVGATGAGKSALAQAMLGELFPSGLAHIVSPNSVAYAGQVPWIFEGSIQENIMAGHKHDLDRYHEVLHATALLPDLALLPGGDQVAVGSRGVGLTSSQRARIGFARVAYAEEPGLVILDDPFASLTQAMSRHVFQQVLLGPLLRERTRVVVMEPGSHELLGQFDRVVLLDKGYVVVDGPPKVVMASRAFQRLWSSKASAEDRIDTGAWHLEEETPSVDATLAVVGGDKTAIKKCGLPFAPGALGTLEGVRHALPGEAEVQAHATWRPLATWLRAGGPAYAAVAALLAILQRVAQLAESLTLARWANRAEAGDCAHRIFAVTIFVIVVLNCSLMWINEWIGSRFARRSATELHDRALAGLARAPVDHFYDRHPLGRVLNRMSMDLMQIDGAIVSTLLGLLRNLIGTAIQQIYILTIVPVWATLSALPLYAAIAFFGYLYRGTVVSLTCCSRVNMSIMQELTSQLDTAHLMVRANGLCPFFLSKYRGAIDATTRTNYLLSSACKSWMSLRVSLCLSFQVAAFALYATESIRTVGVGTLGLVVSFSFALMSDFEPTADLFARFALLCSALQRVAEFSSIPQEAPEELAGGAQLRLTLLVGRGELVGLELQQAPLSGGPLVLCEMGGKPLLQATVGGHALTCAPGRRLAELAPGNTNLPGVGDGYHLVAINGTEQNVEGMAKELCCPSEDLRLDLWHASCARGVQVRLQGLRVGYGAGPDVLRGLSAELPPLSRTALVGPTGSGKSTLLLCLLRLLEPRQGQVLLGEMDAARMGLRALRTMVGLVPQDPTVFKGSWRSNLDPWGHHSDERLWEVLRCVHLLPQVKAAAEGLLGPLGAGGCGLSLGQRQQLSLARALVHQPPVLLADDSVSALDPAAREAAWAALRTALPRSTVLAVAARPGDTRGFDRVLLLRHGEAAELRPGTPTPAAVRAGPLRI